jgi:hypothetical protein
VQRAGPVPESGLCHKAEQAVTIEEGIVVIRASQVARVYTDLRSSTSMMLRRQTLKEALWCLLYQARCPQHIE